MVRRSFLTTAVMVLAALLAPKIPAAATDPAVMISKLGTRALEVLGKDATQSQRVERFHELLKADFDVPGIARFVLGRYWNIATEEQRAEFTKLFENYIAMAYATRLSEYSGETFKVVGSRPNADGAIVSSQIIRPTGAAPVKVDWRLTGRGGTYKIADVSVDGISMAVTQRSEFASVIQHHGGQVQGLLAMLREKTAGSAAR
ncbi:MAG: ABC transporter substrate-binding protein [Alphaproteobacteria bacterium]|nr:ABC transporter substrate-binding protein [Alphaproteobacteria bacterium]